MQRRILVSWIGHADLRAFANSLPPAQRDRFQKGVPRAGADDTSRVAALVTHEQFDAIHLISDLAHRKSNRFARSLRPPGVVHHVPLSDPRDYAEVYRAANEVLKEIADDARDAELCIHLSSGTRPMSAAWVLLGKTRYPATFYQTHLGLAWKTEIPFEITADFLADFLRQPDVYLQHLATTSPSRIPGFQDIIGDSPAIRAAVGRAQRIAQRSVPVLIVGETGTGKEVFARAIHVASPRREGPFVAVNCAAVPEGLLEAELFGTEKGAASGVDRRSGAFEQANRGTLFLDEVGECSPRLQGTLLRALQPLPGRPPCEHVIRRVGGSKDQVNDVRVIAATNRDLIVAVRDGKFREDLFHRLAVLTIRVPPLRHRRADIPRIAEELLTQINEHSVSENPNHRPQRLSPKAIAFMRHCDWPGNVRQLKNTLLRAAVLAADEELTRTDLDAALTELPGTSSARSDAWELPLGDGFELERHLAELQRHYLQRAMDEAQGQITWAARLLGFRNYQTLAGQLKRFGIRR